MVKPIRSHSVTSGTLHEPYSIIGVDYWVDHIGPNKMRLSTNIDGFIRFFPVAVLNVNSFPVLVAECP